MKLAHFLRMLIEKYFPYWPTLELSSRITMEKLQKFVTAVAGVCRQLLNEYLNSSNVNVLPSANNVIEARPAALVPRQPKQVVLEVPRQKFSSL
jgi:hypothetical protein